MQYSVDINFVHVFGFDVVCLSELIAAVTIATTVL